MKPLFKSGDTVQISGETYTLFDTGKEGGQGRIYKAEKNGEAFAAKVIKTKEMKTSAKRRLSEEVTWCLEPRSKSIIHILNFEERDEYAIILMPFYKSSLRDLMRKRRIDYNAALNHLISICEALEVAHKNNVFHRDVKPENILIDGSGNAILADFGIAHFENESLTKAGDWLGNRDYAAPEQRIKKNALNVGSPADVFAIGLIINELFTGMLPMGERFVSISETNPYFRDLDHLVSHMTRQRPDERIDIRSAKNELIRIRKRVEYDFDRIFDVLCLRKTAEEIKKIPPIAQDILLAKRVMKIAKDKSWGLVNTNYHEGIRYSGKSELADACILLQFLDACEAKFSYECGSYRSLLDKSPFWEMRPSEKDCKTLEYWMERLDHKLLDSMNIAVCNRIRKLFYSCTGYHCQELLEGIPEIEKTTYENLEHVPLLHLAMFVQSTLLSRQKHPSEFPLELYIAIENLRDVETPEQDSWLLASKRNEETAAVLFRLKEKYENVCWMPCPSGTRIYFEKVKDFVDLKNKALNLAKGNRVFEGDVLSIFSYCFDTEDSIVIELDNIFEIPDVLGKILENV